MGYENLLVSMLLQPFPQLFLHFVCLPVNKTLEPVAAGTSPLYPCMKVIEALFEVAENVTKDTTEAKALLELMTDEKLNLIDKCPLPNMRANVHNVLDEGFGKV